MIEEKITVLFGDQPIRVAVGENTQAALAAATLATLAANSAAAAARYFVSQAAGQAGSTTGQFFSHPDGAGGLVYRERTSGGSTIIAEAATKAQVDAIRSDLADTDPAKGAALVRANAYRSVNAVLADGPWLDDYAAANDTAKFQAALTAQVPVLRLPPRAITLTAKLSPTRSIHLQGFGGGRRGPVITSSVNDFAFETLATGGDGNPIAVSASGIRFAGNPANLNSGCFNLYDAGNAKITDCFFDDFKLKSLRFKYGVGIILDNLRLSLPAGAIGIELDGVGDVTNGATLTEVYPSGGATAFKFATAQGITMIGCRPDGYTVEAINATGGFGRAINCFFEGPQPGTLTDFYLHFGDDTRWTAGSWTYAWSDVSGSQRMQPIGPQMLGSAYRSTTHTPTAADTWNTVPLTTDGESFFVIHYAGFTAGTVGFTADQENKLTFEHSGIAWVGYDAMVDETAGAASKARARLVKYPVGGGAAVEVLGTARSTELVANGFDNLSASVPIRVVAGDAIALEFGASATTTRLGIPANGAGNGPNLTTGVVASVWARSAGLTK